MKHEKTQVMNTLKAHAMAAWEADDGQSSVVDIASATATRASRDGLISSLSIGAASAMLAVYLRKATAARPNTEAQATVSAKYAQQDAATASSQAAASAWLSMVESSRREVQHVICPHSNAWVPQIERAHAEDGTIIATRRMMDDGWEPWQATPTQVPIEPIIRQPSPVTVDDSAALAFVATLPSMTPEQAKAAYWSLPSAARNSTTIRSLPKAIRRQF